MFNRLIDKNQAGSSGGFSLVEVLFYLAILTLVLVLLINILLLVVRGQEEIIAYRLLERSAVLSLDRITRLGARAVTVHSDSTLGSDPGDLRLVYMENEEEKLTRFYLSDDRLHIEQDGQANVLTPTGVKVNSFVIHYIETPLSEAFRLELELATVGRDNREVARRFYVTQVLRNSYID